MSRSSPARVLRLTDLLLASGLGIAVVGGCDCGEEFRPLPGSVVGNLCSVTTGKPMPGHPVLLETEEGPVEVETDLFGQYEAKDVAAGAVTVSADVDGETRKWDVNVTSGEETRISDDQCRPPPPPPAPPAGSVSGCVCNEDVGEWVTGANVFVVTPSGDVKVTGTDDVGCFALEGVPVGAHVLKVEKGSFYREHDVTVTDGVDFPIETPETCEPPEEPPPPPPPDPTGDVAGRVCAPDGTTWLSGATVTVTLEDGTVVQTSSDDEGRWTLEGLPPGTHSVTIVKGSFSTTIEVEVSADEVTTLPEGECEIEQNVMIAVVDGIWDDVKSVLLNVGIDPSTITDYSSTWGNDLLLNYDVLAQYDIVFLNCGLNEYDFTSSTIMRDNLRQFVENGGSVYASDQAYDVVEITFPDFIDFEGEDSLPNSAQKGVSENSIQGAVVDLALATALGSNQIELHYPLAAWAVMTEVAAQVRVYIRGNAKVSAGIFGSSTTQLYNVPHTVGFSSGQGKVIYTSFHQEPGINQQMERVLQLLVFEL